MLLRPMPVYLLSLTHGPLCAVLLTGSSPGMAAALELRFLSCEMQIIYWIIFQGH